MKVVLAFLCLAVYCVSAQEPKPCMTPTQWEGKLVRNDFEKKFLEFAAISYDEQNQRFRIVEELREGSEREYYDTLYLHNIGREYKFNIATKKCNVTDLHRPFRGFGIPPFAKFVFEAEIGAAGVPGESFIAQTWEAEFENKDKAVVTVTYPDCIPITSGFYSNETGFVQTGFNSISLGISNPEVFIPPRECIMGF